MYKYYQRIGGTEQWTLVHASEDLSQVKPTFETVLSVDVIITDDMSKEDRDKVRYLGPLYFDLDDEHDVANSIRGGQELIGKLRDNGLQPTDFQIFLSGKKGIHILVPQSVFMDRVSPLQKLPAIYKECAFNLAVDTLDFKVYTARKGRMLRTCYNVRDNGNYKVPVTVEELNSLTPELYASLCSHPRQATQLAPQYRAKFALLFDTARQKITKLKPRKSKPVDATTLASHLPIIQEVMKGAILPDIGFNKIAMQLALYAREAGISPEQLVTDCALLIENHQSDGRRYNSKGKREHELRRMCSYVEENPCYEYAVEPIRAMLPKGEDGKRVGDDTASSSDAEASGGVVLRNGAYWAVGNGDMADKMVMDAAFRGAQVLHDRMQGAIACMVAEILVPGHKPRKVSLERADFGSSSALHRLTSAYGVSFMGTDIHARGIYELMLKKVEPHKYVTECEGLDVIKIPSSPFDEARKPFLIWADNKGVRIPQHITDLGITFQFQGWPEPEGVCKTDLTNAPPLKAWLQEKNNKERMATAIQNLLKCHQPDVLGKAIGWMVASFWRQLFHTGYDKFPLLHVNGVAGSGKTELVKSLLSFFYYNQIPRVLTPTSTPFSIMSTIAGSASIPIVVDEYKPPELAKEQHNRLKLMFRDAYNKAETSRGGGSRTKESFGALQSTTLSGPICFIAEAMESETALLERVVLCTIKRQPTMIAARNYNYFQKFRDNKDVLSILGHNIAAHVAKHGSLEAFRTEFDAMYAEARQKFLLQPGDEERLDEEEIARKTNGRERIVYNTTVAAFGLKKFMELLQAVYTDEYQTLFGERLAEVQDKVYSRMEDTTKSTLPEYIKVLLSMSDQSRLPNENFHALVAGVEYDLSEEGGLPTLHLCARISYAKYRGWLRNQGQTPLYQDDRAFAHSLQDAPQFLRYGQGTRQLKVDTIVLDYNALLRAGIPNFVGKPVAV